MDKKQENWLTPLKSSSHHIKYYLQLKKKKHVGGRDLLWEVFRQSVADKGKIVRLIEVHVFSTD